MAGITINQLRKTYDKGRTLALDDISLHIHPGELFGIIGPDGAGKTSLLRILATLLLPDSGSCQLGPWDVVSDFREIRRNIGYMPGRFSLYQDLSVHENLSFFAKLFNTSIQANYDLIRDVFVQLEPFSDRLAGALSGGMKQKLALSCALIHRPQVLLLDEPTTGIDAVSRKEFWEMLQRIRSQGITIVVSTPYMNEASLCDRVALLQGGRLLAVDSPAHIVSQFPHKRWRISHARMYPLLLALRRHPAVESVYPFGEEHHLGLVGDDDSAWAALTTYLEGEGFGDFKYERITPDIEDIFMARMTVPVQP
jgi:ABC-type multidrug transport system ATPase subunit